jgi:hypothetical protein
MDMGEKAELLPGGFGIKISLQGGEGVQCKAHTRSALEQSRTHQSVLLEMKADLERCLSGCCF